MAYTTVAKSKAHFDVKTYQGTSSAKTISGVGFKPDIVWTKDRTEAYSWGCYDSSRGIKKWIKCDSSQSQNNADDITNTVDASLTAFTSDGFTIATMSSDPIGNKNGNQFAAWMWKANGGTTASNSDGSITSTVQVNSTAKFSIVTYTGTGSNATIGHGLGVAPKFIMIKRLNSSEQWQLGHFSKTTNANPETDYLEFTASGTADNVNRWNDTLPTTSVVSLGTHAGLNASGSTYVAYCFTENKGFSAMGAYTGMTDNADGPMIYTGFRPSMIIIKRTDGNESWQLADIARSQIEANNDQGIQGNLTEQKLKLDSAAAESHNSGDLDIYSTGFKLRDTDGIHNYTNYKYVYMAFSEASIVGTNGTIALAY